MDLEFKTPGLDVKVSALEDSRLKTPLRMNYEAQARVTMLQIGSLEQIREKLGLSQRKMAQLLMVDPSAWTRWVKTGQVPPHVYRSLQWYLALREKIPGLTNEYFLSSGTQLNLKQIKDELGTLQSAAKNEAELRSRVLALEGSLKSVRQLNLILAFCSLLLILIFGLNLT